jgi:two-component system sensor histidine kinase HydH
MSDRIFLIISTVLFLLLSLISVIFFGRERFFEEQSGQFMAEQLGDALYRQYNQGETLELPDSVLGFHIFAPGGRHVFSLGAPLPQENEAPPLRDHDRMRPPPGLREGRPKALIPIRQGEFLFQKMVLNRRDREINPEEERGRSGPMVYVLHITGQEIRQRMNFWLLSQALAPVLILLLYGSILIFYFRNRQYRRKLQAQQEEVRAAEVAQSLSHEIKNPLAAIRLQTKVLEKTYGQKDELEVINQEVARISNLIDRMKGYLRSPQGHPQNIALREVLLNLSETLGIPLSLPPTLSSITFDPQILRSVLENVLRNAQDSQIQQEPDEALTPLGIQGETDGKWYILSISDRGVGMDQETIKRATQAFFTTKAQGTGIGLSLVKKFMEAAGGSLGFRSKVGEGTTVQLRFLTAQSSDQKAKEIDPNTERNGKESPE